MEDKAPLEGPCSWVPGGNRTTAAVYIYQSDRPIRDYAVYVSEISTTSINRHCIHRVLAILCNILKSVLSFSEM